MPVIPQYKNQILKSEGNEYDSKIAIQAVPVLTSQGFKFKHF